MTNASAGRFRILLVEDSLEEAFLVRALVESEGLGEVVVAQDGVQGAELVREGGFHLVICDLNLPGRDGLDVIQESKREYPERPIIVTTGYDDSTVHADALQAGADRILVKPLDRGSFLEALWQLLASGVGGSGAPTRTILAVAAYPGDAELGCGGILAGHARQGCRVYILSLSSVVEEGVDVTEAAQRAARRLGVQLILGDVQPGDSEHALAVARHVADQYQPDTVLAPSAHDRSKARLVAHRAALQGIVRAPHVYAYQSATSAMEFRPHLFATIEKVMDRKLRALEAYGGAPDLSYLDPEMARITARYWSRFSRHSEVEPLELLRSPKTGVQPVSRASGNVQASVASEGDPAAA